MLASSPLASSTLASLLASGPSMVFVELAASIEIQSSITSEIVLEPFTMGVGHSTFSVGVADVPSNLLIAANNATAVLALPIGAVDAVPFNITLTGNLSKFSPSGAITIDTSNATVSSSEILYFDGKAGQTLTVTARAQDSTTAKSFAAGALVQMRSVARHHNLLAETLIDVEAEVLEHGTVLNNKSDVGHTHSIADTTGLQPALDAKLAIAGGAMTGLLTLSGAPTSDLHAATKLYVDSIVVGSTGYNVRDYGLVGNGTTDDTSALQGLVNIVASAGGGRIFFPKGVYLIAGPLQDTAGSNAQIVLPLRSDQSNPPTTIDFVGEVTPPTWLFEAPPPNGMGYSIIKSTLTGASGTASLIGGKNHPSSTLANFLMPNFRDLIFQTPPNCSFTVLSLENQTGNRIDHVLIHDGSTMEVQDEPTHNNSYGVKLPPTNHSSRILLDTCHVIGFYHGVKLGELTQGSILAQGCKYAVDIPWCHHPSMLDFIGSYGCAVDILASGGGERALYVELLSLQNDAGYGQPWQARVANVYDPSNVLRGRFNWYNVQAGSGVDHTFVKTGGINFIGTELW